MGRLIGAVILVLVGLSIGFVFLNQRIYTEKQGESMQNTTDVNANDQEIQVIPISHASMILDIGGILVYNDPVGGADAFVGHAEPDILLLSDIHGDHLEPETVQTLTTERTVIVAPQAVVDELPESLPGTLVVLSNGETTTQQGIEIEAVPMYNVPESDDAMHIKGRGNGYILTKGDQRVYIAGDTGGTPEMRALQNIDIAFVPMNLPYTMSVEEAADAVLAFKPKVVHPYHYRGPDGLADVNKFKELVNDGDKNITVELLDFYPEE